MHLVSNTSMFKRQRMDTQDRQGRIAYVLRERPVPYVFHNDNEISQSHIQHRAH